MLTIDLQSDPKVQALCLLYPHIPQAVEKALPILEQCFNGLIDVILTPEVMFDQDRIPMLFIHVRPTSHANYPLTILKAWQLAQQIHLHWYAANRQLPDNVSFLLADMVI